MCIESKIEFPENIVIILTIGFPEDILEDVTLRHTGTLSKGEA